MCPRLWEVGVYSQPPHERWGLELRTSLFLSERTKLGAHQDRRNVLRNDVKVRAHDWLLCSADVCCVGGVCGCKKYSSQCWFNKVFLLCSALKWLLEFLSTGLGVEFLLSRSSTQTFFPPSLPSYSFFSQRRSLYSPPPPTKEKKCEMLLVWGPFNPIWCGMSSLDFSKA